MIYTGYAFREKLERLNRRWYLSRNNEVFGPYARGQILQWLREGKIIDSDRIRREDIREWKRTDECSELQAEIKMSKLEEKGSWLDHLKRAFISLFS